jgi:hypothetical protein
MVFYGSAVAIVVFSAIASFAGVDKGVCRLSKFDMLLALLFLVFTDSDLQQWQRECTPVRPLPAPEADPLSA